MEIVKELKKLENKKQAKLLQGFFKTGKGQYGEGDIFLGIKVPEQRKVAKKYLDLSISQVEKLLHSKKTKSKYFNTIDNYNSHNSYS